MRTHAMRAPARLNVRDDFALEPGEIGVDGQHDEKQKENFYQPNDDLGVRVEVLDHGWVSASVSDSIMEQKRVRVPVVKSVSPAERIRPAGTTRGAWPLSPQRYRPDSRPHANR